MDLDKLLVLDIKYIQKISHEAKIHGEKNKTSKKIETLNSKFSY